MIKVFRYRKSKDYRSNTQTTFMDKQQLFNAYFNRELEVTLQFPSWVSIDTHLFSGRGNDNQLLWCQIFACFPRDLSQKKMLSFTQPHVRLRNLYNFITVASVNKATLHHRFNNSLTKKGSYKSIFLQITIISKEKSIKECPKRY